MVAIATRQTQCHCIHTVLEFAAVALTSIIPLLCRMGKLVKLDVLIVGMKGLGVEIGAYVDRSLPVGRQTARVVRPTGVDANLQPRDSIWFYSCSSLPFRTHLVAAKNLILAGPRSVTLFDPEVTTIADCGTNVSEQICHLT